MPPNRQTTFSPYKPTFFVAEACNRPWVEAQETIFEYARDKYWQEISGMQWNGSDPDFLPLILAYGQSQVNVCNWDFTQAVRYWADGKHANHGFALYSITPDYMDYMICWSSKAKELSSRPALMVIYEPQTTGLHR